MKDRQPHTLSYNSFARPVGSGSGARSERGEERGEGLARSGRVPFLGHDDAVAGQDLQNLGVTVEVVEGGAPIDPVTSEATPAPQGLPARCSATLTVASQAQMMSS